MGARLWTALLVACAHAAARTVGKLLDEEARVLRCDDSEDDPRVNREACRTVGLRSWRSRGARSHSVLTT